MPPRNTVGSGPSQSSAGSQAPMLRIVAAVLWALAIGGEIFAIFRLLRQNPVNMTLLIAAIVVIGILAFIGDALWKRANVLDPASTSDPARFFIQNQLGAIIGVIAFLPLVIMIFLNKNMSGQQKGIAGGIGIVVLLLAAVMGVSINPPSAEQYAAMTSAAPQVSQTAMPGGVATAQPLAKSSSGQYASEVATVVGYTGQDLVFWKVDSTVYHLCANVSSLQRVNATNNTIYSGTVEQAHAAGVDRLTLEVSAELKECGYSNAPTPTP